MSPRHLLAALGLLTLLAWMSGLPTPATPPNAHPALLARREGLLLSGLFAFTLLSLAMYTATRPAWLESPLGGMDRVFRLHKWAGIAGISIAALHWVLELSGGLLKSLVGRGNKPPRETLGAVAEILRDVAKDTGEWAIYPLLLLLALALWKRFPYRPWRTLHRAMPLLYLLAAFHALLLAPLRWWSSPPGALLTLALLGGLWGCWQALAGRIGRHRQASAHITALSEPAPGIVAVDCRLDSRWRGHRAGQFAFVTFDRREGAHPFTIATADRGDGSLGFQIKALGDYTRNLADQLRVGQPVLIEGPYGRFDLGRRQPGARQVWIAGGIGITPFLAWLDALPAEENLQAEFHYCTRDRRHDPFASRLEALCARRPGIRLHIHDDQAGQRLQASALGTPAGTEFWFCGPSGLATTLRQELARHGAALRFHQEAFNLR